CGFRELYRRQRLRCAADLPQAVAKPGDHHSLRPRARRGTRANAVLGHRDSRRRRKFLRACDRRRARWATARRVGRFIRATADAMMYELNKLTRKNGTGGTLVRAREGCPGVPPLPIWVIGGK